MGVTGEGVQQAAVLGQAPCPRCRQPRDVPSSQPHRKHPASRRYCATRFMDRVCRLACAERPPRPGDDARLELADEGGRLRGSGGRPLGRPGSPAWPVDPALAAAGPAGAPASIAAALVVTGEQLAAAAGAVRGATEADLPGEPARLRAGAPQALPWPCLSAGSRKAGRGACWSAACRLHRQRDRSHCLAAPVCTWFCSLHGSKVAHGVSCAPPAALSIPVSDRGAAGVARKSPRALQLALRPCRAPRPLVRPLWPGQLVDGA